MNVAQFSIEKNRISLFVLLCVLLAGISIYSSLARDSMPPFTIRVATVVSSFPGASPERVELLVTDAIEKVAQELPELKQVNSTSRTGLSVVSVTLKDEVSADELQAVWDRLRRKIESMQDLPDGVVPELKDDGIGEVFGIAVALTSDGYSYVEMKQVADDIRDELIKLRDAAKVEFAGVQDERVFIEFDNAQLAEYNLSASKLQNIIATTNILGSGGQINLQQERIILEPSGNFNRIEDIKETLVPVGTGNQLIYLGDITNIRQSYLDPPKQLMRANGLPAISFHVSLKDGANITALGRSVDQIVRSWQQRLPIGMELSRIASMDNYIEEKVDGFVINLLQSVGIIFVVMLLFLGMRTGLIVASLIPLVTITTVLLMGTLGLGLNQVTLAALIMALGMMVDNAIVVAESIMVKVERGVKVRDAALQTSSELATPLLISTLTSAAAFLSFYLAESNMGDIVGPIFQVISIALLSSWLIALSITTLLCVLFLRVKQDNQQNWVDASIEWLKQLYKKAILIALAYAAYSIVAAVLLFAIALWGFRFVPFVFFPDSDRNLVTVDVNLPLGTNIETTDKVVSQIESFISDELLINSERAAGVKDWSVFVGEGPEPYDMGYTKDEANSSYAHLLVNTTDFLHNNMVVKAMDRFTFENIADAEILVGLLEAGGGGTPIEIKISGDDPDQLASISSAIKLRLRNIEGTKNVTDDWGPKSKKIAIDIDQARAQAAGVTSQDIATSLRTFFDGVQTGEFRQEDKSIPIMMRSKGSQSQSLAALATMNVFAQSSGRNVPLLQVATITPQWQYAKIRREDLIRTINVSSELAESGNASSIMDELTPWLEQQSLAWPPGYSYSSGGDAETTSDNMGAVYKYLPLSALIIVLLLIVQFNSARKTLIVLSTMPMCLIGVTIGLLIFREPFGFMPFLGLIALAGIIINNAIVLIDRIEIESRVPQRTVTDAVLAAALQRFRPIVLATLTTILGLLPLYLSGGEMWQGMAIGIMFGLLFGTLVTLLLVPCLYCLLFRGQDATSR